jgi:D-alanyl-D-alanine carboxypeptidase (penicillin-binding protein 5/6)
MSRSRAFRHGATPLKCEESLNGANSQNRDWAPERRNVLGARREKSLWPVLNIRHPCQTRRQSRHRDRLFVYLKSLLVIVILLSYIALIVSHASMPNLLRVVQPSVPQTSKAARLSWPAYGQGAVGASYFGVLASHGRQNSAPMASTAKIITAMAVLEVKPLSFGQVTTPVITLRSSDVDIYNSFVDEGGSVARVLAGERISEYQALQAMLLPSANNIADSLAIWAFGSLHAYTIYANRLAAQLGLSHTHLTDPSGFSPATTSTAADIVKLSLVAMNNPVFAEIVDQSSAVIPVAGKIHNVNFLLGRDGVVGIKSGNTHQAGGVFVIAGIYHIGAQRLTVIAVLMGAPTLSRAILDSVPLLTSAEHNFVQQTVVKKNTTIGNYDVPWASRVALKTTKDLDLLVWGGSSIVTINTVEALHFAARTRTSVGTVVATSGGISAYVPVVTSSPIVYPSLWWRMGHPNF